MITYFNETVLCYVQHLFLINKHIFFIIFFLRTFLILISICFTLDFPIWSLCRILISLLTYLLLSFLLIIIVLVYQLFKFLFIIFILIILLFILSSLREFLWLLRFLLLLNDLKLFNVPGFELLRSTALRSLS